MGLSRRKQIDQELKREPRVWQYQVADLITRQDRKKKDPGPGLSPAHLSEIMTGRRVLSPAMFDAIVAAIKELRGE